MLNAFTAMLAAPALGKGPMKRPNLKSLRLALYLPSPRPSDYPGKGLLSKCRVLKVDFLLHHQIYCLQVSVCVSTFQPGKFTGWGSEGLNTVLRSWSVQVDRSDGWTPLQVLIRRSFQTLDKFVTIMYAYYPTVQLTKLTS